VKPKRRMERTDPQRQVLDSVQLRLDAARAKEAFATALVDLWDKQEDVAEATVAHRESAVELTRYEVAAEAGTAKDLNRMDFSSRRHPAEDADKKRTAPRVEAPRGAVRSGCGPWVTRRLRRAPPWR
jgi:hypothetical protein